MITCVSEGDSVAGNCTKTATVYCTECHLSFCPACYAQAHSKDDAPYLIDLEDRAALTSTDAKKIPPPMENTHQLMMEPSLKRIQKLLDGDAVISGAGNETHDHYFYRQDDRYVYLREAQGYGKSVRHSFPATHDGLIALMTHAVFHGTYWARRIALDEVQHAAQ